MMMSVTSIPQQSSFARKDILLGFTVYHDVGTEGNAKHTKHEIVLNLLEYLLSITNNERNHAYLSLYFNSFHN